MSNLSEEDKFKEKQYFEDQKIIKIIIVKLTKMLKKYSPKHGGSALLGILIETSQLFNDSKELFMQDMSDGWDHYAKQKDVMNYLSQKGLK